MTKPRLTFEYCAKCGWLLRSAWLAQELLTTFTEELGEVALRPAEITGTFKIYLNEELIFDRKRAGGFPEIKELKQQVRDLIAPGKPLGHSDRPVQA
ncbi:MAG: SelT/SelW/SelH family protein [Siphonobacter sp.]